MADVKRKSNFTKEETEIIVDCVRESKDIIFASHKDAETNKRKTGAWKDITFR